MRRDINRLLHVHHAVYVRSQNTCARYSSSLLIVSRYVEAICPCRRSVSRGDTSKKQSQTTRNRCREFLVYGGSEQLRLSRTTICRTRVWASGGFSFYVLRDGTLPFQCLTLFRSFPPRLGMQKTIPFDSLLNSY